jgi:hypothetical protein
VGTISTAIPSQEYLPLLDAIQSAADICTNLPKEPGEAGGFALAFLSRWVANAQAFVLLRNASFWTDAYAIARVGSELAIQAAWVENGVSDRFTTQAARVKALIEQGNYKTRVWLDKMHERHPSAPRRYDDTTDEGRTLIAATPQNLPTLEQMAACTDVTKDMYAFAYRGESGAVHSAAGVLSAHGDGRPPLAEPLMLHNVLVVALVVFSVASGLLKDERAANMAARLQQAVRDRVSAKSLPT